MFSFVWEQRKLGDISDSYSGGTPSISRREYYGGTIPFIRSAEIGQDHTELYLTEEGLNNSSAKNVEVGDLLYALYGATSGEVGISQIKGAINQAILVIKPKKNYNTQFIGQWLGFQKTHIISKYLQGGQGNLSGSIVKRLEIKFPSFDEQNKISLLTELIDNSIAHHQRY
ncbi:restriction endonuclease subunit S [Secundilactobacillus yichangensis]|uniref:restriction endonuclease subunit S n=1 Tax=Secundilactobacillus yichangensis TaxID=2799580 RepID=UPI0019428132|nr:restriction endonuclease subunit S [Secundilactobacillus yichangensis]